MRNFYILRFKKSRISKAKMDKSSHSTLGIEAGMPAGQFRHQDKRPVNMVSERDFENENKDFKNHNTPFQK